MHLEFKGASMKTKTIFLNAMIVFTTYGCASQGTNYSLLGCATGSAVGAGAGFLGGGGQGAVIGGVAGCAAGAAAGYLVHTRTEDYGSAQAALESETVINNESLAELQQYNKKLVADLGRLKKDKLALHNTNISAQLRREKLEVLKEGAKKISANANSVLEKVRSDIVSAEAEYQQHSREVDAQSQQLWSQTIEKLKQKEKILVNHIVDANSIARSA